jgi:uncharacterized membrane protein YfcA
MSTKRTITILSGSTLTASGHSAAYPTGDADAVEVVIDVGGATGTSPSLTFGLSYVDPNTGVATALTGVTFTAITAALATPQRVVVDPMYEEQLEVTWTISGTTPSFTGVSVSINVINRSGERV